MTLTENLIDGSGSNTYNFTFPILDQQDVKVQLREFDPLLPEEDQIISQISTTAFDVLSSPNRVVFTPIEEETIYQDANGDVKVTSSNGYQVVIRIYRDTDIDGTAAYFYPGSAIRAEDLNDNFRQLLFNAQESAEELEDILGGIFPDDSIPGTSLKDGAVTTEKIADGAVTPDKLDRVYVEPGDNVSDLVNDANYVSVGDNVSDLVNDADYVSVGDNVSDLVNDLNYLEPGDNVSELTNDAGYITASEVPPTGVTKIVAGNNVTISPSSGTGVVTVNSTGGGGGGGETTEIYGTAKVWGSVNSDGTKNNGVGYTVSPGGTGLYVITFDEPRADADYSVTLGVNLLNQMGINYSVISPTGFQVYTYNSSNNEFTDLYFSFAVFDNEPVIVSGGSGGGGEVETTNVIQSKTFSESTVVTVNSSNYANAQNNFFTYTPASANSKLIVQYTFNQSLDAVIGVNTLAYFRITDGASVVYSSIPTAIQAPSNPGGVGLSSSQTLTVVVDNDSTDERTFSLNGKVNVNGQICNVTERSCVITEIVDERIVAGGGGGGGETKANIYGTAKANCRIVTSEMTQADGVSSMNGVKESFGVVGAGKVSGASAGEYFIDFEAGLFSDTNYACQALPTYGGSGGFDIYENTSAGRTKTTTRAFFVTYGSADGGPTPSAEFSVTCFDNEPAEIIVGSGTVANTNIFGTAKAAGAVNVDGTLASGFGCTVSKTLRYDGVTVGDATGVYYITFDKPLANANYAFTSALHEYSFADAVVIDKDVKGCKIYVTYDSASTVALFDYPFDFAIHDNQPAEVALTTFGDVINYSGAAAWGDVKWDGEILGGLNIASVIPDNSQGLYTVEFSTPMPDSNYAVVMCTDIEANSTAGDSYVYNKTPTGFQYYTYNYTGSVGQYNASFAVFATNALPPKGGTGTDAWATVGLTSVNGPCDVPASFNVEEVNQTVAGKYEVVFTTQMPSNAYSVTCTSNTDDNAIIRISDKSTSGFSVITNNSSNNPIPSAFDFQVNATNATLPATLTIEGALNPTGSVTMFAGATVPAGWLECNGQAAPSALAAVLGQANVPDLRGEFVRGWDNGANVDAGRALLSSQADTVKNHTHTYNVYNSAGGAYNAKQEGSNSFTGTGTTNAGGGGAETRPRNVALMYIIKT